MLLVYHVGLWKRPPQVISGKVGKASLRDRLAAQEAADAEHVSRKKEL